MNLIDARRLHLIRKMRPGRGNPPFQYCVLPWIGEVNYRMRGG